MNSMTNHQLYVGANEPWFQPSILLFLNARSARIRWMNDDVTSYKSTFTEKFDINCAQNTLILSITLPPHPLCHQSGGEFGFVGDKWSIVISEIIYVAKRRGNKCHFFPFVWHFVEKYKCVER